jgi:hypothetical protein
MLICTNCKPDSLSYYQHTNCFGISNSSTNCNSDLDANTNAN